MRPSWEVSPGNVDRASRGDFGIPDLLRLLSKDCVKRKSVTIYDWGGVYCPELPGFFLGEED
jgi:hypothetical protein